MCFYFIFQEENITDKVEFLLLASDGLWDVVSNQVFFRTFFSLARFRDIEVCIMTTEYLCFLQRLSNVIMYLARCIC